MIESKHHDKNRKNPKYCMKFLLFFQFSHWLWQGDKFVPRFIYSSLIRNETSDNQNRQIYRVHRSTVGFSKEVGTFVGPSLTSKYLTTRKFRNIHFHPVRLSGLSKYLNVIFGSEFQYEPLVGPIQSSNHWTKWNFHFWCSPYWQEKIEKEKLNRP